MAAAASGVGGGDCRLPGADFQEEVVEELGEPVQAAYLLTDVKTYRRWLEVFAVLVFGLFLLAKWAFLGHTSLNLSNYDQWWYPVWVMAVGLVLAKCYDRRWLALYILGVTAAAMIGFVTFNFKGMDLDYPTAEVMRAYLFARLIPIGAAGLIGTGVALC